MLHIIFVRVAVSDTHLVLTVSFGEVVVVVPVRDDSPGLIAVVEGETRRINAFRRVDVEHGMWQRIAGGSLCAVHHRVITAVAAFVDCDIGRSYYDRPTLNNRSGDCIII